MTMVKDGSKRSYPLYSIVRALPDRTPLQQAVANARKQYLSRMVHHYRT